ncbi:MAG TPA: hypothetical protein VLA24_00825 [Pseudomonadales bacterium]|nr:hypothetical protein [Pseudomonadales bacterium]
MRSLAEFAMRRRATALLVAVLSTGTSLFFWVGAAVVALVTLRKGTSEGLILLLWSLLPAGAVLYLLAEVLPLANLIAAFLLAVVLRNTVSLALTLIVAPVTGVLLGVALLTIASPYLDFLVQVMDELVAQWRQGLPTDAPGAANIIAPGRELISGGLVVMHTLCASVSILLARWWQATLYNPGGFAKEFHHLRLSYRPAAALLLSAGYCLTLGNEYALWATAISVPLLMSGLGLLHYLFNRAHNTRRWLWLLYFSVVLIDPVKWVICLLAVIDSFIDVRRRVNRTAA